MRVPRAVDYIFDGYFYFIGPPVISRIYFSLGAHIMYVIQ